MVECSIMIALSTVLSVLKIVEMPYGGSVTVASALPIIISVYRHGLGWGAGCAIVNGAIQLLLGLNTLSYFTTWQSVVAIILLDYIVAFGVFALSGIFSKIEKRQNYAMIYGALLVSILRYVCHVISGCTVWAGLSIPTEAALVYSLSYNATYMLPETIVLVAVCAYVTSVIDFRANTPTRVKNMALDKSELYCIFGIGLSLVTMLVLDVAFLAPYLQDPESGEFVFSRLSEANYTLIGIISGIGILIALSLLVFMKIRKAKKH